MRAEHRLWTCVAMALCVAACAPETSPDPGFDDGAISHGGAGGRAGGSGAAGDAGADAGPGGGSGQGGMSGTGGDAGFGGAGAGGAGAGGVGAGGVGAGSGGSAGDAGLDAGRCPQGCEGDTPVCDAARGACVQCLEQGDCDDGQVCAPDGACVQCTSDADCTDPAAAYCNVEQGRCERCISDSVCARLGDTPACDEVSGRCVACTADTEAEQCGEQSCSRSEHVCTTTERGSLLACNACQADSECGAGLACVEHRFGQGASEVSLGTFCFYRKDANDGCADTRNAVRPYGQELATVSVDSESAVYCLPITSCQAFFDATSMGLDGGKSCTANNECGLTDLDDAWCPTSGPAMDKCSYSCTHAYQCPSTGFVRCSGSPGLCEPMP